MTIWEAIILGLVQGLTEFIPVSSSGHLILASNIWGLDSSFGFDLALNIGTLLALVIFFRRRLLTIIKDAINHRNRQLIVNIVVSTVPALVVGLIWGDFFGGDDVRNTTVVITMLVSVGIIMFFADKFQGDKHVGEIQSRSALNIGLAQAVALIPGTSRSGITMLAGRLNKLNYAAAAEYSFLIAIPIISGAIIKSLFDTSVQTELADHLPQVLAGIISAALSGWLAIGFMIRFLKEHGLRMFGIYRIILAVALLFLT